MKDPLYTDELLAHYFAPRNFGWLEEFNAQAQGLNPLCGDWVSVRLRIKNGQVADCSFSHQGCVISRAAGSIISEFVKGKPVKIIKVMSHSQALGLLKVEVTPGRLSCVTLMLETLKRAVYNFYG